MYVREVHIQHFRHLKDVHIGPLGPPTDASDVVVLAGPNGGGKSSILELLGYALSNTWSLAWSLSRSFPDFSFEVALGLRSGERDLVRRHITESTGEADYAEVLSYLEGNDSYYRSYNYDSGIYQANATLHNRIHNIVTSVLREQYGRSIGFFLKSDRAYPSMAFSRDRLFAFSEIQQRPYLWGMAFNTSDLQYRDMFEFLVQQRYHYIHRLGAHYAAQQEGEAVGPPPEDPLSPYAELLERLFPHYKFVHSHEEIPTGLYVELPTGETVPFSDLSSGEKEVFFILSFFLRHDVSNAVVVIDEPELHLHPQLARLLIRTMLAIRPANQLWVATHNGEIVDEAGRDRVTYIARTAGEREAKIVPGTSEPEATLLLKDFFGASGYIGVARAMVFLEGIDASSDRRMFAALFPDHAAQLKFIPAQSNENLGRINIAALSIMEAQLGWMEFFLIRDHDYLTAESIEKYRGHTSGRMFVLNRYHIENYLLDERAISSVLAELFNIHVSESDVLSRLRKAALLLSGEVLRDMVAFRLNLLFRPEDFSMGKFLKGQGVIDADGNWDEARASALTAETLEAVKSVGDSMSERISDAAVKQLIADCRREVEDALAEGDGWRTLFPGRALMAAISKDLGVEPLVLQNATIRELAANPEWIPNELRDLVTTISGAISGPPTS
jgi:energy-coupling factor transporter ATP-binding protein EcfA2